MRQWSVVVAPSVWSLIREQVLYVARHSAANALAWEARLDAAIFRLADAPAHAVDDDASSRLGRAVHKLVFEGTYLVHYHLDAAAGEVHVVGFRHGARQPREGEP